MPDRPRVYGGRQRHAKAVPRRSSSARGYDGRWRRAARRHLLQEPLCRLCLAAGRTAAAECVDHIQPHKGDHVRFWDPANWQSLCLSCHGRKSQAE